MFGQWMGDNRIDLELEREEHQMTDKQKEAIENVEKQLEGIKKANECGLATRGEFNKDIEAIETILNLIQTQQAEIEKKDKIIDLMSEELTTPIHSKEWVKEYYERKVENGN